MYNFKLKYFSTLVWLHSNVDFANFTTRKTTILQLDIEITALSLCSVF
jgi:hypothetical protein